MSAAAMANWAAGSSGVGPGVNRRVFRIMILLVLDRVRCDRRFPASNNHIIHIIVFCVSFILCKSRVGSGPEGFALKRAQQGSRTRTLHLKILYLNTYRLYLVGIGGQTSGKTAARRRERRILPAFPRNRAVYRTRPLSELEEEVSGARPLRHHRESHHHRRPRGNRHH